MEKILVVDDEQDICTLLKRYFSKKGYEVETVTNGELALSFLKKNPVDLVICDFKLPDYSGLEILQKIKIINPKTQVIIITGYSDVRIAVEALKKGAFDYVTKPLYPDEILLTAQRALGAKSQPTPAKKGIATTSQPNQEYVIGLSPQSKAIQKHIDLIAPTDMSVIILGETGTGKEYVAKAIHAKSKRAAQPFVAIDCGALPQELAASELFGHEKGAFTGAIAEKKGCFEQANGGTLFLDEIGNLTYENQIKLLRVLQEQTIKKVGGVKDIKVDVRVVVATNENLKQAVESGEFREDIYHRLNEFRIELSPLRARPVDVVYFAKYFLQQSNQQLGKTVEGFDEQVLEIFKSYYWYGNLRELGNVVKRSVLLCQGKLINTSCLPAEIIEPDLTVDIGLDMPIDVSKPISLKAVTQEAEKRAILEVLKQTKNNKTKTAELLDVDRKTLYNKLSQYDIQT
ncbi:sigma-54 dependent transcriptional regulator [Reichenbachiella agarivorans]|uniref:Sigma-54 dependent transcriptional regulator n=1 Tax=Reichenbachiella agarivorans TaxID=2979464 RepID=A0ABY6CWB0_9BACT|nr:sigma-54 dependent transcriptional regulator [Reichenbachiella agarivorans]UXP32535.1 sigma-54 dependent transcriptional regulator [Reichenbachiella agarivorans]